MFIQLYLIKSHFFLLNKRLSKRFKLVVIKFNGRLLGLQTKRILRNTLILSLSLTSIIDLVQVPVVANENKTEEQDIIHNLPN